MNLFRLVINKYFIINGDVVSFLNKNLKMFI